MGAAEHTPAGDAVIEVRDLNTRFGAAVVHENVNLSVQPGEIFALVGGSGTGKSTLLREIILLQPPVSGSIRVFGQEVVGLSDEEALPLRRRWGVMFERGALFSSLTVAENVGMVLHEHTRARRAPDPRDRRGQDRAHRAAARCRRQVPERALRRHAQARLARPRARARSGAPVPRRADRGARSAERDRHRRARAQPARRARPHHHDGHARSRSAVAGRGPRRGARQEPHRRRRHDERALAVGRSARPAILLRAARPGRARAGMEAKSKPRRRRRVRHRADGDGDRERALALAAASTTGRTTTPTRPT